jgi:hypothetical protein
VFGSGAECCTGVWGLGLSAFYNEKGRTACGLVGRRFVRDTDRCAQGSACTRSQAKQLQLCWRRAPHSMPESGEELVLCDQLVASFGGLKSRHASTASQGVHRLAAYVHREYVQECAWTHYALCAPKTQTHYATVDHEFFLTARSGQTQADFTESAASRGNLSRFFPALIYIGCYGKICK